MTLPLESCSGSCAHGQEYEGYAIRQNYPQGDNSYGEGDLHGAEETLPKPNPNDVVRVALREERDGVPVDSYWGWDYHMRR
jgi:hypothetical protein